MIETLPTDSPKIVGFKLSGKLHDDDYKAFVPAVETVVMPRAKCGCWHNSRTFMGGTPTPHGMISSSASSTMGISNASPSWANASGEAWMAQLCKPFTQAKGAVFRGTSQVDAAWAWLHEGVRGRRTAS